MRNSGKPEFRWHPRLWSIVREKTWMACTRPAMTHLERESEAPMIIDCHVHVLPPEDMAAFTGTQFHKNIGASHKTSPTTIENALEAAKIGGVDITVISNPIHNLRDMDPQQQFERCQRQNRFNAECQSKYHGAIVGMASTVPYGGDKFLREFERAIKEDGLKAPGSPRACRANILTTTRQCRSSNSPRSSTCRWSFTRRRSALARSACATIGSPPALGARWTARLRSHG